MSASDGPAMPSWATFVLLAEVVTTAAAVVLGGAAAFIAGYGALFAGWDKSPIPPLALVAVSSPLWLMPATGIWVASRTDKLRPLLWFALAPLAAYALALLGVLALR